MTNSDFYKTQFLEKYDEFLSQIKIMYPDKNNDVNIRVQSLQELDKEVKLSYGEKFINSINSSTTNKNLLLKRKIKLFSSKDEKTRSISYSLLNKIPLKKFLNGNLSENNKVVIWDFIQLLYVFSELSNKDKDKTNNKDFIKNLLDSVEKNRSEETEIVETNPESNNANTNDDKNILGLDVNNETNNMINDIVGMFQNSLENNNNGNPFKNIVDVTKKITENYQNKIENGDIDLDGLLKNIQKTMPDIPDLSNLNLEGKSEDEIKHIIDENFSTDDVALGDKDGDKKSGGMNLGNMMNMMNKLTKSMGSEDGDNNMDNLGKLVESMGGLNIPDNEEDAKEHSEKMRKILEEDFNMDLSELDKLKESLETKGEDGELNDKDYDDITSTMSNLLSNMNNDDKSEEK